MHPPFDFLVGFLLMHAERVLDGFVIDPIEAMFDAFDLLGLLDALDQLRQVRISLHSVVLFGDIVLMTEHSVFR